MFNTQKVIDKCLGKNNLRYTEVKVDKLPECDFCGGTARYDGKTGMGPWANMCPTCFKKHGVGLGLGKGQVLKEGE